MPDPTVPAEAVQAALVEQLAEAIPTELTATPHVGIGSARRVKIAWAVLPVVEAAAEQIRREERERIAAHVREIAADSDWGHVNLRAFIARHKRLKTGDSPIAVLLALADEIETPGRDTYPKETDRA